jgi:hypothetical protein
VECISASVGLVRRWLFWLWSPLAFRLAWTRCEHASQSPGYNERLSYFVGSMLCLSLCKYLFMGSDLCCEDNRNISRTVWGFTFFVFPILHVQNTSCHLKSPKFGVELFSFRALQNSHLRLTIRQKNQIQIIINWFI